MDGKRGHVTCGNPLTIELEEFFQKFASLEEELWLFLGLLRPCKISHILIWEKMTPARIFQLDKMKICFKTTHDASYVSAKEVDWPGYE